MPVDRVKPLKIEAPDSGGVEVDEYPTSLDITEDYIDCRGVTVQNGTSNDENVRIERTGNDLVLLDSNCGSHTLSSLLSGGFDVDNIIIDNDGRIVYNNSANILLRI